MTKIIHDKNFARSAIAPEIKAGVMIANINWNAAKASSGIGYTPPLLVSSLTERSSPPRVNSPKNAEFAPEPKASEYP